ncbi:hypothetical protein [Roseofilum capinflatum]|uniref:Uncharacterized protein n=1 Tax=Roseofilum capinflatum BLCC-M114 TaxID=3022440 RepID=A0ABT7B156_9CYAN|nr:hypothetical protein [Roseofilum capinflatum]MDJ1172902.1 hypothetical protein [Roseofilum capinflatum BLCC-M114]
MKAWEFLIQKDGDRAWLPLEPPSVEVLEGHYRLVLRSPYPHTAIEIHLSYQLQASSPPQIQTRQHRTNKEGLMVVFPYTYLKPGLWDISCIAQPADQPPQTYQVSLEALCFDPEPDEIAEDIEPQESEESEEPQEPQESEESEEPEEPEAYDSSFFDVPPPPERPQPNPVLDPSSSWEQVDLSSVKLILDRTMYVAQSNSPITLTGQLRGDRPQTFSQPIGLQLAIALKNPQNLETLQEFKHQLILQSLPVPFEYRFNLPDSISLCFILGQAQLFDSWPTPALPAQGPQTPPTPLTETQFSLTMGLEQLMEAITVQRDTEEAAHPPILPFPLTGDPITAPPPVNPPSVNLDLFNIAKHSPPESDRSWESSVSSSLPPQLFSPSDSPKVKYLQLPSLNGSPSPPEQDLPQLPPSSEPEKPKPKLTLPPLNLNRESQEEIPEPPEPSPPSPVDEAFHSLHLQDKFSERLNDLAKEAEDWVEDGMDAEADEAIAAEFEEDGDDDVIEGEFVDPDSDYPLEGRSDFPKLLAPAAESQEIVLDPGDRQPERSPEAEEPSVSESLSSLPSVPMPILEAPERDWIAEEVIPIKATLATRSANIHIKYWLVDAQTRTLLEEPRWLVDLVPEGYDRRSILFNFSVPKGAMEIQVEAIAVELLTQRESHKTSFRRLIIPPNLPEVNFEELEP